MYQLRRPQLNSHLHTMMNRLHWYYNWYYNRDKSDVSVSWQWSQKGLVYAGVQWALHCEEGPLAEVPQLCMLQVGHREQSLEHVSAQWITSALIKAHMRLIKDHKGTTDRHNCYGRAGWPQSTTICMHRTGPRSLCSCNSTPCINIVALGTAAVTCAAALISRTSFSYRGPKENTPSL